MSWTNGGAERDASPNSAPDYELVTMKGTVYNVRGAGGGGGEKVENVARDDGRFPCLFVFMSALVH